MMEKEKREFMNIRSYIEMCATDRMRRHSFADKKEHTIDFQIFRFLTGYDEALEEISALKAEIELRDKTIADIQFAIRHLKGIVSEEK